MTKQDRCSVMTKRVQSPLAPLPLYNISSAAAWGYVLYNVVSVFPKVQQPQFYKDTKNIVSVVQCCAIIEVFNSLLGIVRSPFATTVGQILSRLLLAVGVIQLLPDTPQLTTCAYPTMLAAWSIAEFVRYLYYFYSLTDKRGPSDILILLRYNLFWVLYPVGVTSELLILYSALPYAEAKYTVYHKWLLLGGMFLYIPMFPVLFSHMVTQRRKAIKKMFEVPFKKDA